LARFYCDHDRDLDAAMRLANEDLVQRQDIFGYDTVAWALYKTNRPSEAADAIQKALILDTQYSPLFFHAGMIYHRLGDKDKARQFLQRALALNPHFSIADSQQARQTLRSLGDSNAGG
jgi:tetratricopeptide (TPR) repeat protein